LCKNPFDRAHPHEASLPQIEFPAPKGNILSLSATIASLHSIDSTPRLVILGRTLHPLGTCIGEANSQG